MIGIQPDTVCILGKSVNTLLKPLLKHLNMLLYLPNIISYPCCENGVRKDVCEKPAGIGQGQQAGYEKRIHFAVHHFHNKGNKFIISPPPPTPHTDKEYSTKLNSKHQNTIADININTGSKSDTWKLSTSGIDGLLVNWDIKSLESAIAGLTLTWILKYEKHSQ